MEEAEGVGHPGEVVGLGGAGARGGDDDEQLVVAVGGGWRVRVLEDGEWIAVAVVGIRIGDGAQGSGEMGEEVEEAEEGAELPAMLSYKFTAKLTGDEFIYGQTGYVSVILFIIL